MVLTGQGHEVLAADLDLAGFQDLCRFFKVGGREVRVIHKDKSPVFAKVFEKRGCVNTGSKIQIRKRARALTRQCLVQIAALVSARDVASRGDLAHQDQKLAGLSVRFSLLSKGKKCLGLGLRNKSVFRVPLFHQSHGQFVRGGFV